MGSDKKLRAARHKLDTPTSGMPQIAPILPLPVAERTDPCLDLGQEGPVPIVEEPDDVRDQFDKLDANIHELAATPTFIEFEEEQRARKRGQKVLLALIALAVLGGYIFTWFVSRDVATQAARQELLRGTVAGLEQANVERAAIGLPQIPIEDVIANLDQDGIVSAVTTTVLARIESDPRFRGPSGAEGVPGSPGLPGTAGTPGAAGQAGTNGTPGTNGQPGSVGLPGTDGANGTNGVDGRNGIDGKNGNDGATGPPPNSFTINGQTCRANASGSTDYTCTPDTPTP
jgi:hypothetical protein